MGYLKQCELRKGNSRTVSWIPEHGAKKGNVVELKALSGTGKEKGWAVYSVGGRIEEHMLYEHQKMHRVHRNGSDVR